MNKGYYYYLGLFKRCYKCGKTLLRYEHFDRNAYKYDGRMDECKDCKRIMKREWQRGNSLVAIRKKRWRDNNYWSDERYNAYRWFKRQLRYKQRLFLLTYDRI